MGEKWGVPQYRGGQTQCNKCYIIFVKRLGLGLGTGTRDWDWGLGLGTRIGDWDWGLGLGTGIWDWDLGLGNGEWENGKWEIESTPVPVPKSQEMTV